MTVSQLKTILDELEKAGAGDHQIRFCLCIYHTTRVYASLTRKQWKCLCSMNGCII